MLTIEKVDTTSKAQVKRFVELPYRLYARHPQWVPPLRQDAALYLNRRKHFFYDHSQADFFLAVRAGRDVGRIATLEHRLFNDHHGTRQAQFYLFECENDREAAAALFEQALAWARQRGLNKIIGPKGFGTLDPFGILIEGFEYRQMMTMSNYNYAYYRELVEGCGFVKEVDFSSYYLHVPGLSLPAWIYEAAGHARGKGGLQVQGFKTGYEGGALWAAFLLAKLGWNIKTVSQDLGQARCWIETYNRSMAGNWEYYPLTGREITAMIDNLQWMLNLRLPKAITHQGRLVGVLLALPDISAALQQAGGRLGPASLRTLLQTIRRPASIALAGMGVLPQYRLQGGLALMLVELEKTVRTNPHIQHVELHQVADTAGQVRRDIENFGFKPYKIHRVYTQPV